MLKQQKDPCPKCRRIAGWTQYLPGVPILHNPEGLMVQQFHESTTKDGERKRCAHCNQDITDLIKVPETLNDENEKGYSTAKGELLPTSEIESETKEESST